MFKCESDLFNIECFEELVLHGNWDLVEIYLSYFVSYDSPHSMKMYLEIRKQKYLEALDKWDFDKANEIVTKELGIFSKFDPELIKELTGLLRLKYFREHGHFTGHATLKVQRKILMEKWLKPLLLTHPIINLKLHFPILEASKRLFIQENLNYSHAGLASQSAHLFPMSQLEPRQTIARSVQGLLSPQQHNLPTIYQQGGATLLSISNFRDISNSSLSGISNTMMLPAPSVAGSSRPFFDANVEITTSVRTIEKDPPSLSSISSEAVTKSEDVRNSEYVNPRLDEVQPNKRMRLNVLSQPNQIRSLTVSEPPETNTIMRLKYTNSGTGLVALASNGINLLWKLLKDDTIPDSKATTMYHHPLQLWEPGAGKQKKNEGPTNCFAMSNNDSFLMSASWGTITLFDTKGSETRKFRTPSSAPTYLLFHPQDNNVIIVGMDDSTILIYNVRMIKIKLKLEGHCRRITGLAFSTKLNVLVSSAADAEIKVWEYSYDDKFIEKKKSSFLHPLGKRAASSVLLDTQVQFRQDQIHFLAVNKLKLAMYETTELKCKNQWCPVNRSKIIGHATFSCDGQLVYAAFKDGIVSIFSASNLQILCEIHRAAYLPSNTSSRSYPLVIAAHPQKRDQFALGFKDGRVIVIELLESIAQQQLVPPHLLRVSQQEAKLPTAEQMADSFLV